MSAALPSFKPALAIRASLPPSPRKPDLSRPNPGSVNWWAPLFGWPSDPSHAAATATIPDGDAQPETPNPEAQKKAAAAAAAWPPGSRFALGGFTEEKAKQLRRKTRESSSFHDAMYHSAIAARLASDSD